MQQERSSCLLQNGTIRLDFRPFHRQRRKDSPGLLFFLGGEESFTSQPSEC